MHEINGQSMVELALSPQINGQVLAARAHVAYCRECAQALAAFIETPQVEPAQPERGLLWAWTETKKLVVQFTETALEAFQPKLTQGFVLRQGETESVYHYEIKEDQQGYGLDIEVTLDAATDTCKLIFTVFESAAPEARKLSGARVSLSWEDGEWPKQITDAFGMAIFDRLPFSALDTLTIEIEPPETAG
jgi:hypothetical protein